ncbi:MAG: DUF928 domain-containing protein [Drouetiella hepatica Uher 2000/2452]|jgi:hypothetical protein|uniref:DUF928 domain-containing protein n=1 Tax=Drouetiella hepatica Uher 2000/2452 TaxID=904376 RepID=A0A951QFM0_9CYAN|nr:DUF928 domain-containing protein [Drouetiella hepatica Uher 2000/2452]
MNHRKTACPTVWRKLRSRILTVALALILVTSLWLPFQPEAAANPLTDIIERVRTLIDPGSGKTAPTGRSGGGAGRGPLCPAFLGVSVKALIPTQSNTSSDAVAATEFVWGRTIEANPMLWFYIPYAADKVKTAKFSLLDDAKQLIPNYPLILPLSATPGIVAVRFPEPLAVGKSYNWYLSIVCSAEKPSRNPGVRGWIQRVEPSTELSASLAQVDNKQKYRIYAENGIWYDMVASLVTERQNDLLDPNLQEDWIALLEYLNADDLKDAAIVNCCKLPSP